MNRQGGSVLIVDDNEMNRDMLCRRLAREGYDVSSAADGTQALDACEKNDFDLIVLDIMMPGISGLDVLKTLRKQHTVMDLPVIMATAKNQSEDVVEALQLGANDYVTKPIDFPVLLARVRTQMNLRRLSQQKDEFVRIASHDLKNPLLIISTTARIVEQRVPPGTPMTGESYQMLATISRHARTMERIIKDFLDFQAMEDGRLSLDLEPTDLNAVTKQVVDNNSEYAKSKAVAVAFEPATPLSLVRADPDRLYQVVQNYLGNAIKFGPRNSSVIVRTLEDEREVVCEVEDSGPGLTVEDMKKVFSKYARLSNKPTGGEKSSGLGLAICKELITLHEGQVGVRDNPQGPGVTFWFRLPKIASQQ